MVGQLSPLTQGRGLKHIAGGTSNGGTTVAPHTGAWIETNLLLQCLYDYPVAPHTGAWIETLHRRSA